MRGILLLLLSHIDKFKAPVSAPPSRGVGTGPWLNSNVRGHRGQVGTVWISCGRFGGGELLYSSRIASCGEVMGPLDYEGHEVTRKLSEIPP